jgi:hypothetical protein
MRSTGSLDGKVITKDDQLVCSSISHTATATSSTNTEQAVKKPTNQRSVSVEFWRNYRHVFTIGVYRNVSSVYVLRHL